MSATKKSRKTSGIWEYFKDQENNSVKCNICDGILSFNKNISSFNLTRHLRRKHDIVIAKPNRTSCASHLAITSKVKSESENDTTNLIAGLNVAVSPAKKEAGSKKTSGIWDCFEDMGNGGMKCNFCNKIISIKNRRSTGNLNRHIRKHAFVIEIEPGSYSHAHSSVSVPVANNSKASLELDQLAAELNGDEITSDDNELHNLSFGSDSRGEVFNEINNFLLTAIVKDYLPLRLVESISFKNLLSTLNPYYQVPTRKTISNVLIPKLVETKKVEIHRILKSAYSVCLTTDDWSSIAHECYASITCHFIDYDCKLNTFLLDCFLYSEAHTAESLGKEIKSTAFEWDIHDKIQAVVTDNSSNIVEAVKQLEWKHVPSFAHILNSIVQTALEKIEPVRIKVKRIMQYFKSSPKASELLKAMQRSMEKMELEVKQDIVTRWNSTYDMFKRMLEIKESLISTMVIHYPDLTQLTDGEFIILEQACKILEIFKDVSTEMSDENKVTISNIILISCSLKKYCENFIKQNSSLSLEVKTMAEFIISSLNNTLNDIEKNSVVTEATFLDPRYKEHGFSNKWAFQSTKENLIKLLANIPLKDEDEEHSENEESIQEEEKNSEPNTSKLWDDFDARVSGLVVSFTEKNLEVSADIEVQNYLREPLLLRKHDPLTWWKERRKIYPRLFKEAMKRLCIVGSSAPSDRIFSKAGYTLLEQRNQLTGKRVSDIIFLNANL